MVRPFVDPRQLKTGKQEFVDTRDAIIDLYEKTDLDVVERCFSSAMADVYLEEYAKRYGLKETTGSISIKRLIGAKKRDGSDYHVPASDHAKLWLKNGKPYSYTFEPYGLGHDKLIELLQFCEFHKLNCYISADSQWFPMNTLFVEITRKDEPKSPPF